MTKRSGLRALKSVAAIVTVLVAAACSESPTAPSVAEPIRLTASINRSVIALGSAATITFKLENTGAETLTLRFATNCHILPYIVENRSQTTVLPPGGGWSCASQVSDLVIPPFSSATRQVDVTPARAIVLTPTQLLALPPGEYSAYAVVDHATHQLRSLSVQFAIASWDGWQGGG